MAARSRVDIASTADATVAVGAPLATVSCSYAYGIAPSKAFTTSCAVPRAAVGFACQTMRREGKGGPTGLPSTRPGAARSMPVLTISTNRASVVPSGAWRMLTLTTPAGVITSKSGGKARVAGEPVHEAAPRRSTKASPTATVDK